MATSPGTPPAMAQTAANQIVASLPRPLSELGTGPLEVALDPPELGRVRLSLVEVAGAMTLSITAERPETAELMRRHLDLLAQEFTRSGLDAPSVRVGTEGGGAQGQGPGADGETGARAPAGSGLPEAETGPALQPAPAPDPRRALDLRL
jgi:flagellar hook-length control protein FliK